MSDALYEQFCDLRGRGYDAWGAATELQLPLGYMSRFNSRYKAERQRAAPSYEPRAIGLPAHAEALPAYSKLPPSDDDRHVTAVLACGGYPRAVVAEGRTHWLGPGHRRWRPEADADALTPPGIGRRP